MTEPRIDSGTRRKLRQSLGSRVQRRAGTNRLGQLKPRQLLAKKIEEWKRQQKDDKVP